MATNQTSPAQGGATLETTQQAVGTAVQNNLNLLKATVAAITDPITGQPVQIPDFDTLYNAAGKLGTTAIPTDYMAAILHLLGRGSDFDCDVPTTLTLPADHHIHPTMGLEWYYVCMQLEVTDPNGNKGRIGVLNSMEKQRVIGKTAQTQAGWTDTQCMMFSSLATATLDIPSGSSIIRRNRNVQWPSVGGSINYSQPGSAFLFQCGSDSMSGSANVLPLQVVVNDGTNMSFSLTLKCKDKMAVENAFFLQGMPVATMEGGTGITSNPTPGIYYSWPQLLVDTSKSNTITVDGVQYTIESGSAWIDHQLMMQSLENFGSVVSPVPYVDDPAPFNGWCWQFFNLSDGSAFTGAAFQNWYLSANPSFTYGYFVKYNTTSNTWSSYFADSGTVGLGNFQNLPVPVCPIPMGGTINIPATRTFVNIENPFFQHPLNGTATAWCKDGRFNGQDWCVVSEAPADYVSNNNDGITGWGFLEAVGFEPVASMRTRLLNLLSTGVLPCLLGNTKNESLQ